MRGVDTEFTSDQVTPNFVELLNICFSVTEYAVDTCPPNSVGRETKQMKSRSKRLALGALTAAALTAALPAAPAFATEEINCGAADLVKVTYVQNGTEHTRCWKDPGSVSLNQEGVISFYSGANEVVVFWTTGQGWKVDVLEPHTSAPFAGADTYRVFGFHVR